MNEPNSTLLSIVVIGLLLLVIGYLWRSNQELNDQIDGLKQDLGQSRATVATLTELLRSYYLAERQSARGGDQHQQNLDELLAKLDWLTRGGINIVNAAQGASVGQAAAGKDIGQK